MELGWILVAIVVIDEFLKGLGFPKEILAWTNLVLGVILSVIFGGVNPATAVEGLVTGATASGLYDLGKVYKLIKDTQKDG